MALKIWLPLNGSLENKGISDIEVTNNGATIDNNGKIGQCYYFNGNKQWLTLSQTFGDFYNNDWSIAVWLKPTDSTRSVILSEYSGSGASNVGIELTANRVVRVYWNGNPDINFTTAGAISLNEWTHVAITKKNSIFNLYLNGILKQTYTYNGTLSTRTSNCKPRIGDDYRGNSANTVSYQGYMNDFRLYDHCLSAKEVKEISQGLVLHYKLDGAESSQNLVTTEDCFDGATCFNGATSKYGYGTNTDMYKTTGMFQGRKSTKVYMGTDGLNAYPYVYFNQFSASGTTVHTLSFDYFPTSQSTLIPYSYNGAYDWTYVVNGISGSATNTVTCPTLTVNLNQWNHIEITARKTDTTNTTRGIGYIRIGSAKHTSTTTDYWLFANVQIEEKDHATPYMGIGGIWNAKVVDSSGYGNNGTILGTVTTEANELDGRYLISNKFNENADSVTISPCFSVGQTQTEMTTSIWAKTNTLNSTAPNLISLGENSFWRFRLASASSVWWYIRIGSTQRSATYSISGKNLLDNNWHHYAVTFKNGVVVFYIDGVQIGTTDWSSSATYVTCNNAGNTWHLAGYSATSESFIGNLADARIYTTALSAEDILDLYHTPANIDNLGGIHGFEFAEDTLDRELLALPWTSSYSTHNKTSISTNYNDKHEWYSNISNSSASSDYIKINPTGKTYYYDTEISVAAGNRFYIGFERYDVNKTSRSNNACTYIISIKPTSDIVHQRYFGTVDLATDGVNPTDTIALRILNGWSGSESNSTKEATIHYLSLREVTGKPKTGKIKQQGQIFTSELAEREKQASIYENGFVGGNTFIEK